MVGELQLDLLIGMIVGMVGNIAMLAIFLCAVGLCMYGMQSLSDWSISYQDIWEV